MTYEIRKQLTEEVNKAWPSQYEVYNTFVPNFVIGKAIKSPFRKDNNPSFAFFVNRSDGSILWKDHATGDKGNWITFLKRIFETNSFKEALERYYEISPKIERGRDMPKHYKPTETKIAVTRKPFTKADLSFWSTFGITAETLIKYKVNPIKAYFSNEHVQIIPAEEKAYCFKTFNKFKIYRPFASPENKWRMNMTAYEIMGFEQLPEKVDNLIITKSLKDVMVLHEMGYTAVSPTSEGVMIPKSIIEILARYPKVTILYDNDEAGKKGATALQKQFKDINFNANKIFIDSELKSKDISDLVKNTSFEEAKEYFKQLISNDNSQNTDNTAS